MSKGVKKMSGNVWKKLYEHLMDSAREGDYKEVLETAKRLRLLTLKAKMKANKDYYKRGLRLEEFKSFSRELARL